jgi:hypothetical protein
MLSIFQLLGDSPNKQQQIFIKTDKPENSEDFRNITIRGGKKYFSFCQLDVMRQKVSAKRGDFRQQLKHT